MGKEPEKEYIYICITNHFAVHLKLTQHCKSAMLQYKIKSRKNKGTESTVHMKIMWITKKQCSA